VWARGEVYGARGNVSAWGTVWAYWRIGVSAYRRIGVSAYRRIGVSAYRRIGVSAYRRMGVGRVLRPRTLSRSREDGFFKKEAATSLRPHVPLAPIRSPAADTFPTGPLAMPSWPANDGDWPDTTSTGHRPDAKCVDHCRHRKEKGFLVSDETASRLGSVILQPVELVPPSALGVVAGVWASQWA
jgi:hypothetical protein